MGKEEFLAKLRKGLSGLPQEDIEERLIFYREMIEDRMEEGLSEEDAVAAIGDVDKIIAQIITDTPISKLAKEKLKSRRTMKSWEIVLLVLGFPVWFPLLIAAAVVMLSLYVVVWSVMVSLWAVELALAFCAVYGIIGGFIASVNAPVGFALVGAGIACAGLAILLFLGCKAATKGIWLLTKKMALALKRFFLSKEETQ